jgi:acyl dehydratase
VLLGELLSFAGFPMAINYGLDKLRFPAPLPVGESVRLRAMVAGIEPFDDGATLTVGLTFESSGGGKPVCVATARYRVAA